VLVLKSMVSNQTIEVLNLACCGWCRYKPGVTETTQITEPNSR